MKNKHINNKAQATIEFSNPHEATANNSAIIPVLIVDSRSRISYYNNAFAQRLGYDMSELLQKKMETITVPDFSIGSRNENLFIFKIKNGGILSLVLNSKIELPYSKKLTQFIFDIPVNTPVIPSTISEQINSDVYNFGIYPELTGQDIKIVFRCDNERIIWGNDAFFKFTGLEVSHLNSKSIHQIWPGLTSSYINVLKQNINSTHQKQSIDLTITKGEEIFKFLFEMFPLESNGQELMAIRMIDISHSEIVSQLKENVCKDAESTLHMLDRFIGNASNPMIAVDLTGKISMVNNSFASLYNTNRSTFYGKTLHELESTWNGIFCEKLIGVIKKIITFEQSETDELSIQHPTTGQIMKLNMMAFPLHSNDGKISGCGAIFTDISGFIKQSNELTWTKALAWQYKQEAENQTYLMQTYLDQIPYSTAVLNLEGKAIFVNKYIVEFWNTSREDVFGKHISEFITDIKYVELLNRLLDKVVSNRQVVEEEFTINASTKDAKTHIISMFPLIDKDGAIFAAGIHRMDISELKLREIELQESRKEMANARRLLLDFLNNIPYQVIMLNKHHRIVMINKAFADEINATPEEVIGKFYDECIDEKLDRIVGESNEYVIENQKSISFQESMTNQNGQLSVVSVTKFPVYDFNGEFSYIGIVVIDVTETVNRENELIDARIESERSRQLLQGFMDNATFAMFAKDLEGNYVLANKKKQEYLQSFNKSTSDGSSKTNENTKYISDLEDSRVISANKPLVFYATNTHENGFVEYIKTVKFPLYDKQGNIISVGGISNDITDMVIREKELKSAKQKAEKAATAQERFLASMSHDMRTPLNGIVGMINLLNETSLSPEQNEYVEAMKVSSTSLRVLINDILDISKIQAGKLNIECVLFKLTEVVTTVNEIFKPEASKKNIDFTIEIAPGTPLWLEGDPIRLSQILNNLIGNAIKFTSRGFVQLHIQHSWIDHKQLTLEFEVSDTGIGISRYDMNKLFQPFAQAGTDISRIYGGTGLGLYICKNLIELQNGKIEASSLINVGSKFKFSIPYKIISDKDALKLNSNTVSNTPPATVELPESLRCLIVEDNVINQKVAYFALKKNGIAADLANNGKEAVEILQKQPTRYDFILMDIQMPEMDGYQATKMIRNSLIIKDLPIIAMTASALKGEHERCIEAGMNDFIPKPFMIEELMYVIRHLNIKKATTESHRTALNKETKDQIQADTEPLFSMSNIDEIGDPTITLEIINEFLATVPTGLDSLMEELTGTIDWKLVEQKAHKLKGAVAVFQIKKMMEKLSAIEKMAKENNDTEKIPTLLSQCIDVFSVVEKELITLRQKIREELNDSQTTN